MPRDFVLLEDWLNDGAPLAGPTARECLVGWYGDNLPGAGKWLVGGRRIVPSQHQRAGAGHDPVGRSHRAAACRPRRSPIPNAASGVVTRLDLPLGHIGMVVSGRARELCWTPLIDWLGAFLPNGGDDGGTAIRSTGACPRSGPCCSVISMVAQSLCRAWPTRARRGVAMGFDRALVIQGTSHLVIAALLPALYWLQRRWPASGGLGNLLILGACGRAVQPRPHGGDGALEAALVQPPSWARPTRFP